MKNRRPSHPPPGPEGKALKLARESVGLSQRQLAKLSGLPHGMIGEIESGARQQPDIDTMRILAGAMKLPLWAVLDMGDVETVEESIARYLQSPLSLPQPPTEAELSYLRPALSAVSFGGPPVPPIVTHHALEAVRQRMTAVTLPRPTPPPKAKRRRRK